MRSFVTAWLLDLMLESTFEKSHSRNTKVLDLRSHGLEECPYFPDCAPPDFVHNLKCFCLQSNLLVTFPRANCHCLEKLKILTLDYNRLEDLPFDFRRLKNLTILNISHNNFRNLHFFHVVCQLKNLKILWANAVGLTEIPIDIAELTKLRTLGLRGNRIRQLPDELMSLTNLRWLTLRGNNITDIPFGISKLTNLTHLNLQRNCITFLPQSLLLLEELQYLFLDYNMIAVDGNLKSFIRSLSNLRYCSLSGNIHVKCPISRAPSSLSLIARDVRAISSDEDVTELVTPVLDSSLSQTASYNLQGQEINGVNNSSMLIEPNRAATNLNNTRDEGTASTDDDVRGNLILVVPSRAEPDRDDADDYDDDDVHTVYRQRYGFQQEISSPPTEWTTDSTEHRTYGTDDDDNNNSTEDVDLVDTSSHTNFHGGINERGGDLTLPQKDDEVKRGQQSENLTVQSSENDIQLPFANSSTISFRPAQPLSTQEASPSGLSTLEQENVNLNSSLPGVTHTSIHHERMDRIQEWVMLQGQNASTGENEILQMDGQEEQFYQYTELLPGMVNEFISDVVISAHKTSVHIQSSNSSSRMVYVMPHRRDSQPRLAARASVTTCNNNNNTVSNSRLVVPPEQHTSSIRSLVQSPLENTNVQLHLAQVHQQQLADEVNIEATSNEAISFQTNSSNLAVRAISSYMLVGDDEDSNYDPSDWEYSAPSSAIDDQDIVMRYADFQDDDAYIGLGDIGDNFVKRMMILICQSIQ